MKPSCVERYAASPTARRALREADASCSTIEFRLCPRASSSSVPRGVTRVTRSPPATRPANTENSRAHDDAAGEHDEGDEPEE